MENYYLVILLLIANVLNAISNASKDNAWNQPCERKTPKQWERIFHVSQAMTFIVVLSIPALTQSGQIPEYKWCWYFTIAGLTRLAVFDYTRAVTRRQNIDIKDNGTILDWMLIKLRMPESYFIVIRAIAFVLAFHFSGKFAIFEVY